MRKPSSRCSTSSSRKITSTYGRPLSHRIEAEDAQGKSWTITGTVTAGLPWAGWPNMICQLFLTRWECEGRVGWGDTQEVQWTDYVRACTQLPI